MTDQRFDRNGKQGSQRAVIFFHVAAWLLFCYFWYRYFAAADVQSTAFLLALLTTFFAAATVYISARSIIPSLQKWKQIIAAALTFILVLSFARTICVMVIYRLFEKHTGVYFMSQFFTSLFHISYVFVFAAAIKLYRERYRAQLKAEKDTKERLATELAFLKNQVNPHFLFNIHNSIYFLIHENPDAAAKAVLMLSEIMRYQLYECNTALVPLEKELHNIANYVELEKLRMGKRTDVNYDFTNCGEGFSIAPFILLTLVENAFKHVSVFTDRANFIRIHAGEQDNNFYLSVQNSAESGAVAQGEEPIGIGLKNLYRRLELIYDKRYDLQLSNLNGLFSASLKLPAS